MFRRRRRGAQAKRDHHYDRYLKKVLKQLDPEMSLSSQSVNVLNSMLEDCFDRLAEQAEELVKTGGKKTLTHRDIEFAAKLVLPGDLKLHAISEGQRAIRNINAKQDSPPSDDSLEYSTFSTNLRFHSSTVNSSDVSSSTDTSSSS